MLHQVDDFLLGCTSKKSARNLFNDIHKKIRFPSEIKKGIIPSLFMGVVKDYNRVDIVQMSDYIKMTCKNYITHLLELHGWDTKSLSKLILEESITSNTCNNKAAAAASLYTEELNCMKTKNFEKITVPKI